MKSDMRLKLYIGLLLAALMGSLPADGHSIVIGQEADHALPATATTPADKEPKGKSGKQRKSKKKAGKNRKGNARLTPEEQRRYDYYYLEAIRQKEQRNHAAAYDLLQHCLRIDPAAPTALYELAQYYSYLKQDDRAMTALEQTVAGDPDNYWYSQALANIYLKQKEQEKATELLESMTVRFEGKTDPYYTLLDIYNSQKEYDKLIAILNRLEEKTGKNEQFSMEKLRIYLQKEDNENALREIRALAEEYPLENRYQVILGEVLMQSGKPDEAYSLYQKVLKEEPDNAQAMYALADYYEETEQKELHEQQLEALLLNRKVEPEIKLNVMRQIVIQNEQTDPDSLRIIALFDRIMAQEPEDARLPLLYAQYLLSKEMNDKAMPVLKQVLDIDPTNTAARMTLLGEAVRKEDYPALTNLCEGGVEANPEMLEFYFYLAICYNQAERTDDAILTCRRALERVTRESDRKLVSDFYGILGDSYHSKEMNDKAYEAYESALQYNPENIGTLNNYAYYLSVERRDLDKAEEMSYKTVKAEPQNSTYLDTYAWILFEKGNYTEARIYIDEAMKNGGGESDVIVEHCGDIHAMTGDMESALKHWKQAQQMGSESKTLKRKIREKRYIAE